MVRHVVDELRKKNLQRARELYKLLRSKHPDSMALRELDGNDGLRRMERRELAAGRI